ncbi:hypothetical protein PZ938_17080 [Luteipulveratus sp. YIM 133132]|uniref:hypothetical protein n=1 Tax=Luteipulveratus flavus TaxID=3031728 RepID=UPI0023B20454|nr:hypothetical protein [Luteipulveratus sp. YIM 133132]MDE9367336.1 hypothetical protein [Luteipulveratus sp. YIM 133132]
MGATVLGCSTLVFGTLAPAYADPVEPVSTTAATGAEAGAEASAMFGPVPVMTDGTRVHWSSYKPTAEAWWAAAHPKAKSAKVTIWLMWSADKGKHWKNVNRTVKTVGQWKRVKATPFACKVGPPAGQYLWKSRIDVDLVNLPDTAEQAETKPVALNCLA